ncbi:MAG: DUF350 domain-containing protein [bacterium]|nr:DUF350 domain-containing protein [bacterium]
MIWQDVMVSGVYLIASFVLFWVGKLVYSLTSPGFNFEEELVEKDNAALAIAFSGYGFGLILAIGGVMVGPSHGLDNDLMDIAIYGGLSIVLMNLARFVNDRFILHAFSTFDEIIRDQNTGSGAVLGASYVATGLVINGAVSGVLGGVTETIAFWVLGQLALVLAGLVYERITPYSVHSEIEKDNVAAGIAFSGALMGVGIIVRHAAAGDFISWAVNLQEFGLEVVLSLVLLPIVRLLADVVLLPGRKLTDEIAHQEKPNLGAGFIEAFSYVGASFLIVWSL